MEGGGGREGSCNRSGQSDSSTCAFSLQQLLLQCVQSCLRHIRLVNFTLHIYIYTALTAAPPSPPTSLCVVEVTENSITVSWEPPVYHGTGNLTYKVYTTFDNRPRTEVPNVLHDLRRATIIPSRLFPIMLA